MEGKQKVQIIRRNQADFCPEQEQLFPSEPFILKVKRKRSQEDLSELYLEYDQESGRCKRMKLMTDQEVIQEKFSQFSLDQHTFTIGQAAKQEEEEKGVCKLRLKKIKLPGFVDRGRSKEVAEFCSNLLQKKRIQKKKGVLMRKRGIEEENKEEENLSQMKEEDDEDFDLFLFSGNEPFEVNDYLQELCNGESCSSDQDEEDSNREDHENNEYPDEEEEDEGQGGGYRGDSEEGSSFDEGRRQQESEDDEFDFSKRIVNKVKNMKQVREQGYLEDYDEGKKFWGRDAEYGSDVQESDHSY